MNDNKTSLKQTIPPAAYPMGLAELKQHLRIDGDTEDAHLTTVLGAATEWAEGFWGRQIVAATYRLTLDRFPSVVCDTVDGRPFRTEAIVLPRPPVIAITSVTYVDTGGTTQTVSSSDYTLDDQSEPGELVPAFNEYWPATRDQVNAVAVTYTAGYAAPFTAVAATDVLTITGRTLANGDIVRLSNSGGALPGGLSANTDYHVRDYSSGTLKLAASSGGSAINLTDAGTGTHYVGVVPEKAKQAIKLLCSHFYENREAMLVGTISKEIEFGVKALLWQDRIVSV